MKAIAHDRYGSPDELEFRDVPDPTPGPGQVLLDVHAASVNPLDVHMMTGTPMLVRLTAGLRRPEQPVRGADVAGVVAAVGDDVTDLAIGDRVVGMARGSFAERAVSSAGALTPIPDGMSFADAAALPVAGVTALQAVRDHARVPAGGSILIVGAAGGVGTFAVQIAAQRGLEVTGVCSARNVEMVRELGAARVIDYTNEQVVDGTKYDAIVDNVGSHSLGDMRRSLNDDGALVIVSGKKGRFIRPVDRVVGAKLRFMFGSRRAESFTARETPDELRELLGAIERGDLRPVIDRRFPLAETADAMRYVMTGHARAKVIIEVIA